MILDPRETLRFLEFCKHESNTAEAMLKQMQTLPCVPPEMIRREKSIVAAFSIVAEKLLSLQRSERVEIRSDEVGTMPITDENDSSESEG